MMAPAIQNMTPRKRFLAALRREQPGLLSAGSATSVVTTDLMERVGVYFPEAHLDPEKMAALAAAGHTILGLDNVMPLFGVWHESAALGCRVNWGVRDRMPDCQAPLKDDINSTVEIPSGFLKHPGCAVPLAALRILKRRLGDEAAVVGKVFGPWTLGYHVYGVENFLAASLLEPDAVKRAMDVLKEVTIEFAKAQVEAGADAITLGDHCTRDLCSPATYRDFLAGIHSELRARIPCPLILHICGDTADRLPMIAGTGVACFHFDSKVTSSLARQLAGAKMALMGGTSNIGIILNGGPDSIAADVRDKISCGIDVIGPECAVPLNAPHANIRALADAVMAGRA